jgi:putative ABC transport system permease protein
MNPVKSIWVRIRSLRQQREVKREIDEELRFHIEQRTAENITAGMSSEEGARDARKRFGNLETLREECRDVRGASFGETLWQDIRFGARMLRKNPGFTAIAVMVLALGTGANTTIFSVINSMLIKSVRVNHPEQLVGVYQHDKDNPDAFNYFSYLDFADLRSAQAVAFTELFAFRFASVGFQGDLAEKVSADFVSANYFSALGVPPAMGRVFQPEEETSGAPVAVLTDAFWKKLGADPSILGRKLKLTRGEVTVVGVMPGGFTGAQLLAPAIFFPLGMAPILNPNPGQMASRILTSREDRSFMIMGRLKSGLTPANIQGPLAALSEQFAIPDPGNPKVRTLVCALPSRFNFSSGPSRPIQGLALLAGFAFGMSLLVLVVACLNLANMMVSRGASRHKEIAIRLAIGAGRRRILRQLLTEGFLLALLGGAAGLVLSLWATALLSAFIYSGAGMPADFPKFDLTPDWRVLISLLSISGAATLLFALAPAWKLARLDFNSDLKRSAAEGAGTGPKGRFGSKELLAVGQIAFTLALLIAAVLFSRSAINAADANPGFEFGSNFFISMDTSLGGYPEPKVRELIRNVTERLSALPGVECVSPAMNVPFGTSTWERRVQIGGAPPPSDTAATLAEGNADVTYNVVGAEYFRTLGIPLLRGREFEPHENEAAHAVPVAIISQSLAEQLWPDGEALGRTIQFPPWSPGAAANVMTVVGVVPTIHWQLFDKGQPQTQIYVPFGQAFETDLKFHVRVAAGVNPNGVMRSAREELRRLDPQIPVTEVKTLAAMHRDGPWARVTRLGSMLFGAFGGLAVLLSLLGIYGLKSYAVARRTREIGIRMALGANRRDVTAMMLRESLWLALVGIGLGFVVAIAVANFSSPFLYHVRTLDLATFIIVPGVLLAVVMIACWLPARRAANMDPMVALRYE